jgi:hypothetical protein
MIEYHLVNVTTDQQMGHGCVRQLWVAAGLSTDAVDIVLAKIPLGWAARLSRVILHLRRSQRFISVRETRGNWLTEVGGPLPLRRSRR